MQYDVQLALVNSLLKRKLIKFNSMIIMTPWQNNENFTVGFRFIKV